MSIDPKPRTGDVNGRLWGARADSWANIQEGMIRPVYKAVLERAQVGSGTRYLDAGCGADLKPEEVFDVDSPFVYSDEAMAIRGLNSSGVAARAMEHSSEQAVTEAHAKAIAPFRQPDGSYHIKATFRCLLARP